MFVLRKLREIKRLTSVFGIHDGLGIYRKLARKRVAKDSSFRESVFRLNGFDQPIHLRLATSDWNVFEQVFISQEYIEPSPAHADALKAFYESNIVNGRTPLIVDCGANIGLATIWYARRYPDALVVALEPEPANFALLRRNTDGYRNVIAINAAISDKVGRVTLSNASDAPWTWETKENDLGDVDAIGIDEVLARVPGSVPFIVKVDIEGFEARLFGSNTGWIRKTPLIVVELHDWLFPWRGTAHAVLSALSQQESRDYLHGGENTFCYSHGLLKG